jgi:hypothetical protein
LANPEPPNQDKGEVKKVIPDQQRGEQGLRVTAQFQHLGTARSALQLIFFTWTQCEKSNLRRRRNKGADEQKYENRPRNGRAAGIDG